MNIKKLIAIKLKNYDHLIKQLLGVRVQKIISNVIMSEILPHGKYGPAWSTHVHFLIFIYEIARKFVEFHVHWALFLWIFEMNFTHENAHVWNWMQNMHSYNSKEIKITLMRVRMFSKYTLSAIVSEWVEIRQKLHQLTQMDLFLVSTHTLCAIKERSSKAQNHIRALCSMISIFLDSSRKWLLAIHSNCQRRIFLRIVQYVCRL